jgi:serpin B
MTLARLPALLVALALSACGNVTPPGELASSQQQRITQAAPQADLESTVASNTAFALDVYRKLASPGTNVVFSPYSITTALAMTWAGAASTTSTAFASTLHANLPPSQFHRSMNTLDAALRSRGAGAQGQNGGPFRLNVLNQLFSQKGFVMVPAFLDLLAQEYGAGVRLMDFVAQAEPARQAINAWVSSATAGLIPELLTKGTVDASTRLVLVNTVYFDAAWRTTFDHNATRDAAFSLLDGTSKQVKTMTVSSVAGGASAVVGTTQVLELPYDGSEVSMVLLVPAQGSFSSFEDSLTGAELQRHLAALQPGTFGVELPKFSLKTNADLTQVLSALGLGIAFSPQADFSGLTTSEPVAITGVLHDAVIKVDEAGTEAAAATAVVVGTTSVGPSAIPVNRPFVFLIRDVATNAVIFMGRVVDPG